MLTTREIATLIWFVPAAALIWWKVPSIRESVRSVVRAFLQPLILIPATLFAAWMLVIIDVAAQLGAWNLARLKDTLYWVIPGFILMFGATKAATEPGFFRRRAREAVGVSVFLAFYLGVLTLDLPWELLLVPVLTLLGIYVAAGGTSYVSARAGNRAGALLAVIVLALLVYTTVRLVQNAGTTDWADLASSLALPVWLTLWALPFVWALSVWLEYDTALGHMRIATTDRRMPWKSVLALVVSFRFRRTALHKFAGRWPRDLVMAKGFREARAVIAKQQAEVKAEAAAKQKAADDLKRYAGAVGEDERGRQLDKREFEATVEALDTLANAHMGWYRNHGNRYQRDLLEKSGEVYARGLPTEHGITMHVSNSGQSWYAWRRTPSGLCFAIGAAGPPPYQWFYEGMEPPRGFPKVSHDWSLPPHERGPNWEWAYDPDDWCSEDASEVEAGDADEVAGA